jgi:hypothetical protein
MIWAAALALLQDPALLKEYSKRLAALREDDAGGHFDLGRWCLEKDLTDRAEERFEKVVSIAPDHEMARDLLGFERGESGWKETPRRMLRKECVRAVREGLKFPAVDALARKSALHREALETFCYPEVWVQALIAIREWTGLFDGALEVEVLFVKRDELGPDQLGRATGKDGKGQIRFDLDKAVLYLKREAEVDRERKDGDIQVLLPRLPLKLWVTHQLTRLFQNVPGETWFAEGMACYATRTPYWMCYLKLIKAEITPIEKVPLSAKQHYGRGQAFFEWLEATAGRDKVRQFSRLAAKEGLEPSAAAERATGLAWDEIQRREREWAAKFIKSQHINW